jgi:hypothetical protein
MININVLFQLFDFICASFVLSYRLRRNGSLHDLTLNRRWISSLAEKSLQQVQDTALLRLFLRPLVGLLHEVYHGSGWHLTYDRNSSRIDNQVRNIFVARM